MVIDHVCYNLQKDSGFGSALWPLFSTVSDIVPVPQCERKISTPKVGWNQLQRPSLMPKKIQP